MPVSRHGDMKSPGGLLGPSTCFRGPESGGEGPQPQLLAHRSLARSPAQTVPQRHGRWRSCNCGAVRQLQCWGSFGYEKATRILCYKEASPNLGDRR